MASRCKRRLASYGNQLLRRDFLRDPDPSFIMVLAHSLITSLAADRNHPNQMMPLTAAACFHNVRRELIGSPMEFSKFLIVGNDLAVSLKARTKKVGHQNHVAHRTNRTFRFGLLANSASRPHQFRVSITDFFLTQTTTVIFINQVAARHAMINQPRSKRRHTPQGSCSEGFARCRHCLKVTR